MASFVVCPCCYGSIQEAGGVRYPRSALYRELGFSYQVGIKDKGVPIEMNVSLDSVLAYCLLLSYMVLSK